MNARKAVAAWLFALSGAAVLAAPPPGRASGPIFKAHMAFLADDLLEGRETGTRGFDIATRYVAAQFAQLGLQGLGDGGSFLQAVPFKTGRLVPGSALFELRRPSGSEPLAHLNDFLMGPSLSDDQTDVTAPLVFVGHGITAPLFKHDDYAGIDVKGKIVVVLGDRPPGFPTEEGAHYNNGRVKSDLAASHGAVGIITLQTPRGESVSPFARARLNSDRLAMDWVTAQGRGSRENPRIQGAAFVSLASAGKLFSEVAPQPEALFAASAAGQPLPRMDLKLSARLSRATTRDTVGSSNVVGMIEGSDPLLKNEVVVFTAHLDHLGVRKGMTADNIFNGAMDNASGVATLLEMARLVAQMPVKPRRSILFVALCGEEKGLLGSDFFATNPSVPARALVASVNLDMPILTYDFNKVIAFGAEHSSLKQAAATAAGELKLELTPDPWPEQGLFTRSDHYSFVRQGVPSIYVIPGLGSYQPGEDAKALSASFLSKHYHQPSDDMALPLNWDAAARFAQLNFYLGVEIANHPQRPTWNQGDFFGDLFRK